MSDLIGKDDVWTSDVGKLRADLAAAQRELVWATVNLKWALSQIRHNEFSHDYIKDDKRCETCKKIRRIRTHLAELLAQEGMPAQPQYREPTLEDARELVDSYILAKGIKLNTCMLNALKQLGFYRKVQP